MAVKRALFGEQGPRGRLLFGARPVERDFKSERRLVAAARQKHKAPVIRTFFKRIQAVAVDVQRVDFTVLRQGQRPLQLSLIHI